MNWVCMGSLTKKEKEIENKKRVIYDSDAIIVISENTKRDILKIYPDIAPDKISAIYHGANLLPNSLGDRIYNVSKRYLLYVAIAVCIRMQRIYWLNYRIFCVGINLYIFTLSEEGNIQKKRKDY